MILSKKRLFGWLVFVVCALLVPFVAMQFTDEVNWDLTDFILMGIVLLGIGITYELIAGKSKKTTYRMAFIIGLLGAFLLFWVNGAVGLIGSENQDANLLYGVVFVVGLVGALISRFKAKGMSITLLVASIVQMMVPITALIIWPPSEISWAPSVIGVFLLSGFFALLFYLSSMLFKRSSIHEMNLN
ncbi:hypothetical protein [uncultured Muriicola sp.]|uniref:hypothetical protein n=1 Tax=uncultured Muriicola sp. TaxID=1583102 RepID=UPI0026387AB5|nr:hypothetical protein [uncultured Muriicola sp.]